MISVPKILSQKLLVIPNPVIRYTKREFEVFVLVKVHIVDIWIRVHLVW
jgi:hypothetical protein